VKLRLLFCMLVFIGIFATAQQPDSVAVIVDTVAAPANRHQLAIQNLLQQNTFLNSKGVAVAVPVKYKAVDNSDNIFFYLLLVLVFLLALLRFFYGRYIGTLFRVFFNTSLRQSQLTDQLLQAKLPSLLFNLFFVLSTGTYTYFLLRHYNAIPNFKYWLVWACSIAMVAAVYLSKYSSLKFTGWLTGYSHTTSTYIFVIFLINKILGIVLLPFTILMAFAGPKAATVAALVSLLFIGLLLLMRFLRSYGLVQSQLKINRFHFMLYLAGVEVIPLLLVYHVALILLGKKM
jgi:hypothetical protein